MPLRDGPFGDRRPRTAWRALAALAAAGAIAAGLLILSLRSGQQGFGQDLSSTADGAMARVSGPWAVPFRWLGGAGDTVGAYLLAGSQNVELRRELTRMRAWRDEAMALRLENARFRALMGVRTDPPIPMVLGRTILEARGPFSQTRLADVGSARGVVQGNPVLSEHGLVGRVVGVSPLASRILLLSDVMSRAPVLLPRTNGRAILTGDGGGNPALDFLRTHEAPREGDRVLTSGDGGVFPRGLPVGSVVRGFDGAWRVALDADAAPIDMVRVLLFKDFSQLAPPGGFTASLPTTATEPPPPPAATMAAPVQAAKPGAGDGKIASGKAGAVGRAGNVAKPKPSPGRGTGAP